MIRIYIAYRRNSDGELVTIEHHAETEKEARRWSTAMENAINKSEDVLVSCQWYYLKDKEGVEEWKKL